MSDESASKVTTLFPFRRNTDKCLFSFKVFNKAQRTACCLPCFCSTGLIRSLPVFEIFITHHLTNAPHCPWPCVFCLKDTIQVRRVIECTHCLNNYSKVSKQLKDRNLPIEQTHFLFDNLHEKFEFINPLPEIVSTLNGGIQSVTR